MHVLLLETMVTSPQQKHCNGKILAAQQTPSSKFVILGGFYGRVNSYRDIHLQSLSDMILICLFVSRWPPYHRAARLR